jgi:hypothetical protein
MPPAERARFLTELMKLSWTTGAALVVAAWTLLGPFLPTPGGYAMGFMTALIVVLALGMLGAGAAMGWLVWRIIQDERHRP